MLFRSNPCIAVVGFIENAAGETLFIRRAKEPAKGRLAIPGGFVDAGERAEEALIRETREEVNVSLAPPRFLTSLPNTYPYGGLTYTVLDFYFVASVDNASGLAVITEAARQILLELVAAIPGSLPAARLPWLLGGLFGGALLVLAGWWALAPCAA